MLKKHAQFFKSLFIISDLIILSLAWSLSYVLRFFTDFISPPMLGTPPFFFHLQFLPPFLVLWGLLSKKFRLYRPRRIDHFLKEFFEVMKCLTLTLTTIIALIYLLRRFEFSRLAFFYFWSMGMIGLISVRIFTREILRSLRRRGYNQRFAIIAGTGELSQQVLDRIELYPVTGIQVVGFLSNRWKEKGEKIRNIPVLGRYDDLEKILAERVVDILFIALSIHEYDSFRNLINKAKSNIPDIKVIPAYDEFMGLRGGMDELGDLPVVSLQSSPLYGWDSVLKRLSDLILGSLILTIFSPVMLIIGLIIKLTSEGPMLYKQERMGMGGNTFQMIKFRTMKLNAERETGPIWAKDNDPRRTPFGAFLRKTSLDELPQLFNVLKGEMSLVGPRPERPTFVSEFRNRVPSYMLRHKIKAGMTGWAQVNGWRGNTSVEKRIEHDLYYIQNWSIGMDVKILIMTLWKGFFNISG